MAYKYDIGLEFLRQMKNEDLNDLVEILKGKDNDERISESLSNDKNLSNIIQIMRSTSILF